MATQDCTTRSQRTKDLTGQRFGRLTVLYCSKYIKHAAHWLCQCDCGKKKIISGNNLRRNISKSCGCLHKEKMSQRLTTHGLSHNQSLYDTWSKMMHRCYNTNNKHYADYGGRGITVDTHWHNIIQFYNDMGDKPTPYHTIERINNDGSYNPKNCKWGTRKEQANNRRKPKNRRFLTYNNTTHDIAEWAVLCNISIKTLQKRIRVGWSAQRALTIPVKH